MAGLSGVTSVGGDLYIDENDFLTNLDGPERLVVMDGETPVGLVEMTDILGFLSSHSHVIALRVEASKDFPALTGASAGIVELARSLFAQRVSVRFIMDLLAELHRRIMARNYRLLVSEQVHARTCLLVLGSEGSGLIPDLLQVRGDRAHGG